MSTSRAIRPTPASAKTEIDTPSQGQVQVAPVTRREFLFYVWGASMALALAASGGVIVWFALPRFKAGEFGGIIPVSSIPEPGAAPVGYPAGKFWMSNDAEKGLVAIYTVCTHLGCLYAWAQANFRFECPCHGSKYTTAGTWIEGPAPRSLDRFEMTVSTNSGPVVTNAAGDPIPGLTPTNVTGVSVDTGKRIKRDGRV